uniref:Uncharacterized protein n=1 Tax=Pseudomonas zanjanensis TaxID=2745496 RepID=A0A923JKB8_9PSED
MNKVKTYPDRKQLIEFGRKHCKVDKPALIIERIADAMSQALASSGHRIDGGLLEGMRGSGTRVGLPLFMIRNRCGSGTNRWSRNEFDLSVPAREKPAHTVKPTKEGAASQPSGSKLPRHRV